MSDAATFIILCAAMLVDVCQLLFRWLGDRLAFLGYVAAIAAGFANSGLFDTIKGFIDTAFAFPSTVWNIPLTRGMADAGPAALSWIVLILTGAALMPSRWTTLGGRLASLDFADLRGLIPARGGPGGQLKGPPGVAPMPGARGVLRRIFGGQVNLGMVGLAVLLIVAGATIHSGAGDFIRGFIAWDVNLMGKIAAILLRAK
jgi:hypothetical protein